MTCTRCNDSREVWDEAEKAYFPCQCVAEAQDARAAIDDRHLGNLHGEALLLYSALLRGAASRETIRFEELTPDLRLQLMGIAVTDARVLRNLVADLQNQEKKHKRGKIK